MGNQMKTGLLLIALTAFIVLIGQLLGGRQGMIIAFIFAAGMNFFSYWFSDKVVLSMYRAQQVSPGDAPHLFAAVRNLSQRAGIPMPKLYIIPQEAPNAFATGRNPQNAAVAVTAGLLRLMSQEELEGVLAHELAHVKNRDILISSIAATMAGAVMILANMARWSAIFGGRGSNDGGRGNLIGVIAMSILAPIAAMLIQMAISRSREYHADTIGAEFAGNPRGLAKALEKLGAYSRRLPMETNASTAHMFIVNPLPGKNMMQLFSTHPPLEERIARLLGKGGGRMDRPADPGPRQGGEDIWKRLSGK
jgi:heat shock protein HtpX